MSSPIQLCQPRKCYTYDGYSVDEFQRFAVDLEITLIVSDVGVVQFVNCQIADGFRQVAIDEVLISQVGVDGGAVVEHGGCADVVSVEVPLGVVDRRRMSTAQLDR